MRRLTLDVATRVTRMDRAEPLKQGGRVVGHHTEAFVGIDTSKLRNAIAIADSGRGGEVRYLGEFPATEAAIRKLVAKLAAKCCQLTFCYEAGPTGYGLYRLLKSLGHDCLVVAPSLVPKKAGDRVKTNRRDAVSLAKLLRAGELTAVWVPDERHEAMRDLSRFNPRIRVCSPTSSGSAFSSARFISARTSREPSWRREETCRKGNCSVRISRS